MPLSRELKALAEAEVRMWAIESGGRNKSGILTAESLYRRMQIKYPDEMLGYTLEDLQESVYDGTEFDPPPGPLPVSQDDDDGNESDDEWYGEYDDWQYSDEGDD